MIKRYHMVVRPGSTHPVGTIVREPGVDTFPCDGRELCKSEYSELFDAIGMVFGGDRFRLPDIQQTFTR